MQLCIERNSNPPTLDRAANGIGPVSFLADNIRALFLLVEVIRFCFRFCLSPIRNGKLPSGFRSASTDILLTVASETPVEPVARPGTFAGRINHVSANDSGCIKLTTFATVSWDRSFSVSSNMNTVYMWGAFTALYTQSLWKHTVTYQLHTLIESTSA